MKKRLLLVALAVMLFSCVFAFSASAENNIIKLNELPTLEQIHANEGDYVSHLDALDADKNKEKDSTSVVVLSDLQSPATYYVFPSYYIFEGYEYHPNVSKLNDIISAADSTAYASWPATAGRGGNSNIIRLELPTYVTKLSGWNKFEDTKNMIELYFPTKIVIDSETGEEKEITCVTSVADANTFTNCYKLETIHNFDKLPLGIYNSGSFSNCHKLTGIKLHKGLTSIPTGLFAGCYSLNNLEFHEGITSIESSAFSDCDSMTEIILPNSVTSVSKKSFASMDNLETISFGAGLSNLYSTDHNLEIIYNCNKIKYIYMPASFATYVQSTGNSILSSGTNVTIFFTGTKKQAEDLRTKLTASASNPLIKNAEFVEYDPSVDYSTYAANLGKSILVYNYSQCEAFYNGQHKMAEKTYVSIDSYVKEFNELHSCTQCKLIKTLNATPYAPIFYFDGYSASYKTNKISATYTVNKSSLDAYERITGKTIVFGVVASIVINGSDANYEPINIDGTVAYANTISANITSDYAGFDFILSGFSDANYGIMLAMCAFVSDGTKTDYILSQNNVTIQDEYAAAFKFEDIA